jgi:hypothetical protein
MYEAREGATFKLLVQEHTFHSHSSQPCQIIDGTSRYGVSDATILAHVDHPLITHVDQPLITHVDQPLITHVDHPASVSRINHRALVTCVDHPVNLAEATLLLVAQW